MASSVRVAIVTGANKGIGFATVKKLCKEFDGEVYLTARDETRGLAAVDQLEAQGLHPKFHQLDVTSAESIQALKQYIASKHGGVDILINNAGIDYQRRGVPPQPEQTADSVAANFTSVLNVTRAFLPMVRAHGRIVNVSSSVGHISVLQKNLQDKFTDPNLTEAELVDLMDQFVKDVADQTHAEKGWPDAIPQRDVPYAVTKIAVTILTRVHAREVEKLDREDILVNACCPGPCRTDMSLPTAPLSADDGAERVTQLAFLPAGGPNGELWREKEVTTWDSYTL